MIVALVMIGGGLGTVVLVWAYCFAWPDYEEEETER